MKTNNNPGVTDLLTKRQKGVVELFLGSDDFINFVDNFRGEYEIPENGYPDDEYHKSSVFHNFNDIKLYILQFLKEHNLPEDWVRPFYNYLYYGYFTQPEINEIKLYPESYTYGQGDIYKFEIPDNIVNKDSVVIVINKKVSKRQIIKFINNSEELGYLLNALPRDPINNIENIELSKTIVSLRDKEKLSYKDISSKLQQIYEDNLEFSDILNEDYVKILYHRWKKKISSK